MSAVEWGAKSAGRRANPHHLAWGILLACFALFCLLLIIFLLSANYFIFQSALPMNVILNVGRGTVGLSDLANPGEQVGVNGSVITGGVIIRSDPQSQGTILFMDGEEENERLLASLTLQRNSRVTLINTERPRFAWSRRGYEIALQDVIGEINVTVTELAGPRMRIHGVTPGRARLQMMGPGTYTIEGASEELRLFNHNGLVWLESADGRQSGNVPVGGQGAVLYEEPRVELRPGYRNLLLDESFSSLGNGSGAAEGRVWACDHDPGDNPPGTHEIVSEFGLQPLRFLRDGGVTTHGRNFCAQNIGQNGLNLKAQNYEYLALRVTFSVDHASLGNCGTEGSECPLMLRMDYLDQRYLDATEGQQIDDGVVRVVPPGGDAISWFHGFYIKVREDWPVRCSSCLQDHELINEKSWYVYESPNLLTLFAPEPSPETIVSIWVYASGHEYDVRIRDVALLAVPQLTEDL